MTYHDKIQLTIIIVAPPEQVAEGDRIFRSHAPWMEATHHRTWEKALLSYNAPRGRSFRIQWISTLPRQETCTSS